MNTFLRLVPLLASLGVISIVIYYANNIEGRDKKNKEKTFINFF